MNRILLTASFLMTLLTGFAQTSTLFISEYAEGSSNNKYLEIYNGTGVSVDLSAYSLSSCSNGCDVFGEFDFPDNLTFAPGTILAHGDVYVIAHPSADPAILAVADMTFSFLSNGDDAFALTLAGATASTYTIIDIIGDLQGDIGTGWDVAGITNGTVNHTLVRKPTVCQGNPVELGSFGTTTFDSEWIVLASDDWSYLNYHNEMCSANPCDTYNGITEVACGSYTSPSGNYTWTSSGNYMDTIPNAAMCDSIIAIDLTVNPVYNETDAATICDGTTYTFGTQTLTSSGVYTETFTSVNGCDSTVELTLTVVLNYVTDIVATICDNETYTLGTQTLNTTGNYSETFTSVQGCDSIVNLDLTVLPISTNTITVTACDSYVSPSGGYTWTTSGTYEDTVPAANGCDSIITINLTVNNSDLITQSATACDSYDFEGNTYTSSGVYQVIYTNVDGCDSIRELDLIITATPAAPTTSGDQMLCDGDAATDITIATSTSPAFIIAGVMDGPLPGGLPKCVEFYAIEDIADLSVYGFGSANNGGGTDGEEFTFPAIALTAGSYYRVGTDSTEFNNFFGFYPENADGFAGNVNGDDAIELFMNSTVIDVFGDINVDGTGQPWEYLDGWAYRVNGSQPNGGVFDINEWMFSGINALDNETTNATAAVPYPTATLNTTAVVINHTWYDDAALSTMLGTGDSFTPTNTTGTEDYYVTAELNGCTSPATMVNVTFNPIPTVTANASATTVCEGEMVTLNGSGATTYNWDNGVTDGIAFSATTTTTYTVTGTDANGCFDTDMITINVNALPTVTLSAFNTVCVYDAAFALSGGTPAGGTYSGTGVVAGDFDPSVAGTGTHTITYTYTDGNGCENSASETIVVDGCIGIEEFGTEGLTIYPNPTSGMVHFSLDNTENVSVEILDLTGKVIYANSHLNGVTSVDLSGIADGNYILTIKMNNTVKKFSLIKQ